MGLSTCYPCAKYLLLALNIIFWLSGIALIVLGVLFLLRPEVQYVIRLFNFSSLPFSSIELTAFCIIILGTIIFLIGLFGICGAKRESRTCLILYIILVTCVLLIELGLFAYIAMSHEQWQVLIKQRLVSQMQSYNHIHPNRYERAVDYIQNEYHCCGINSAYDYGDSLVPMSCCSMNNSTVLKTSCTAHEVSLHGISGCFRILLKTTIYWIKFFIIAELGLCLLSLIGLFLAICVCQNTMIYDGYFVAPYRV